MPVNWFVAPFGRRDRAGMPVRYCVVYDFLDQIRADGGNYVCAEVLGNRAICKVRASAATLAAIAALPNVDRIPKDRLDDSLSDFTPAQQQRMRDIALEMGYTLGEINARFPNPIGTYTLGDVLRFLATRWKCPRWDGVNFQFDTPDRDPPMSIDRAQDMVS